MSFISGKYIWIKQNQSKKDQFSLIRSMVQKYFSSYSSLNAVSKFNNYTPIYDTYFKNDCKKAIAEIMKDKVSVDRKISQNQLNQSATENLEYLNYQILKVLFPGLKQLEKLKRAHFSFLEKEFLDIIKVLVKEDFAGFLYRKNIDILNQQIDKDKLRIEKIFSPVIKRIEKKDTPKEESFKDVKQKGTSYIMKETENVREIKVTLEMKDDL